MAAGLSHLGHEVHIVARRLKPEEPRVERIAGVTVHRIYRSPLRHGKRAASTSGRQGTSVLAGLYLLYLTTVYAFYVSLVARAIVRKYGLDVIIERETAFGAGGMASIWTGKPLVLEVIGPRYSRLSVMRSSRILYYTEGMLRRWVDPGKCTKVSSGVNLDLFHKDAAEGRSVRSRLAMDDSVAVIGYVGTFQDWHGVDTLVRAAAMIAAHMPKIGMVLVGPGFEGYRDLADEQGILSICRFTGGVEYGEIPAFINACDVMVAPYDPGKNELRRKYGIGFPLKILEYMACGKPVVASRVAPIDQIITEPDMGVLVDPGDVSGLAVAIESLLEDRTRAEALGRKGEIVVRAQYGWSKFAEVLSEHVQSA